MCKCGSPNAPSKRYCHACHRAYMRDWRQKWHHGCSRCRHLLQFFSDKDPDMKTYAIPEQLLAAALALIKRHQATDEVVAVLNAFNSVIAQQNEQAAAAGTGATTDGGGGPGEEVPPKKTAASRR